MTDQELSQKVKAKYPQYKSMDDMALAQKVKAKYLIILISQIILEMEARMVLARSGGCSLVV